MDAFTFALIAMFGVPFGAIALLLLGHRLTPKRVWFSFPVQTVVTGLFLGAIATPFLVAIADAEGEYFEDEVELVQAAFALPSGTEVDHQKDRTLRLGDCWRNAVYWRSEARFGSAQAFDRWHAEEGWREALLEQIAGYYGIEPGAITVEEGALTMREIDPSYQLRDDHNSYSQNVRILEFREPFVCAAIERDASGAIRLRSCDPVSLAPDFGEEGHVIINPSFSERSLEGQIYYGAGPHYCTNPVRRAVNDALGLDHPEGGEPNTRMAAILPTR